MVVRVLVVYTESSAYVDVCDVLDAGGLKPVLQLVDAYAQGGKVVHLQNLASYVEVKACEVYIAHAACHVDHGLHVLHVYAELVLGQSCGNVGVGVGSDIGVYTECNACLHVHTCGYPGDDFQFGNALDVETTDAGIKCHFDFPVTLADSCKDDAVCRKACIECCLNLPAADTVGSKSCSGNTRQNGWLGTCLDGIVQLHSFCHA